MTRTPDGPPAEDFPIFTLPPGTAALDPDHRIYTFMRENAIGFRPNIAAVDDARRYAAFDCGAIVARLPVPFGWFVIDDGRRTLVFDEANAVQINLNIVDGGDAPPEALIDSLARSISAAHPEAEYITLELGGMPALAFRGIRDGDELLEHVELLRPHPMRAGLWLKTRVVALPHDMPRTLDMVGLMLTEARLFAASDADRSVA